MATELIRFELYYNGNQHSSGLVSSYVDTGLPGHDYTTCMQAVREFNRALEEPPYYMIGENNRAFFTPQGYARFERVIERLVNAIHGNCEGWEVRELRIADAPECFIQYQDEYQKIVAFDYYWEATRKLKEEEYA